MRFDLKRPCKNCPFAKTETRITFATRERAAEIEEIAYRQGFVCHEHAEHVEDDDGSGHFDFRGDGSSQHCFGALAMYLKNGSGNIPWEFAVAAEPELEERWWDRAEQPAIDQVFDDEDDFLDANS